MGWNRGYTTMEEQVIRLYDNRLLTKDILNSVMEPFKETDCDSGGSHNLKANDGKNVEQVICFIMEPKKYADVMENPQYGPYCIKSENDKCWENNEKAYVLFDEIWHGLWGIF